jgi:hypothetical protein
VVALPTEGHVPFLTANEYLLVVWSRPTVGEGTRRPIGAATTEGRETLHVVGQRDTLQKLSKGSAIRVSVETHEIEVLSMGVHDSPESSD